MSTENPTEFRWEEPPPPRQRVTARRKPIDWVDRVARLRDRPGEWALLAEDAARTSARLLEAGMIGGVKAGQVEARAVTNGLGEPRTKIYARWIGGDE